MIGRAGVSNCLLAVETNAARTVAVIAIYLINANATLTGSVAFHGTLVNVNGTSLATKSLGTNTLEQMILVDYAFAVV